MRNVCPHESRSPIDRRASRGSLCGFCICRRDATRPRGDGPRLRPAHASVSWRSFRLVLLAWLLQGPLELRRQLSSRERRQGKDVLPEFPLPVGFAQMKRDRPPRAVHLRGELPHHTNRQARKPLGTPESVLDIGRNALRHPLSFALMPRGSDRDQHDRHGEDDPQAESPGTPVPSITCCESSQSPASRHRLREMARASRFTTRPAPHSR